MCSDYSRPAMTHGRRCVEAVVVASLIVFVAGGCQERGSGQSVANGALAFAQHAIGPIPGGVTVAEQIHNPYAHDPDALQRGRQLFVLMNCSGCHGGHAGGGMGPSLRDVDWIYGGSDADIFSSIAQGRANGMPAWGSRLPEASIWMLVTYVKSLRTAEEPDPPS